MNETVKINGKDYEIDLERAKALGVLKEPQVFNMGDVFINPSVAYPTILLLRQGTAWVPAGFNRNLCELYPKYANGLPVLDYIKRYGYEFVRNINQKI